ncbi:MAG: hypothetical protein K9M07_02115 [Simkaniaceae bacterium]|nr:hypothetical protein [Simkaniaceae bacterium]MCF7852017.1 hypothetical protein [Simkaniaceae bacterium]
MLPITPRAAAAEALVAAPREETPQTGILGAIQLLATTQQENTRAQAEAALQSRMISAQRSREMTEMHHSIARTDKELRACVKQVSSAIRRLPTFDADAAATPSKRSDSIRMDRKAFEEHLEKTIAAGYEEIKDALEGEQFESAAEILTLCEDISAYTTRYGEPLVSMDIKTTGTVESMLFLCSKIKYRAPTLLTWDELEGLPLHAQPLAHNFFLIREYLLPAYKSLRAAHPRYDQTKAQLNRVNLELQSLCPNALCSHIIASHFGILKEAFDRIKTYIPKVAGEAPMISTDACEAQDDAACLMIRKQILERLEANPQFKDYMEVKNDIYIRVPFLLKIIGIDEALIDRFKESAASLFSLNTTHPETPFFQFNGALIESLMETLNTNSLTEKML